MNLKLIKDNVCPVCGAPTVAESCRSRHTCGDGFERREFSCGMTLAWSPNFDQLETEKECPKSDKAVAEKAAFEEGKRALKACIEGLAVDTMQKIRWKTALSIYD